MSWTIKHASGRTDVYMDKKAYLAALAAVSFVAPPPPNVPPLGGETPRSGDDEWESWL